MGDQLTFRDDSGDTRLAGQIFDDGASTGDVLTVQADGSVAAESGGGAAFPTQVGAGNPTGATVPTGIGAVYVDTTNGAVWVAIGATNADWVCIGGNANRNATGLMGITSGANGVYLFSPAGQQVFLTDEAAWQGSGNGVAWNANTDGTQTLTAVVGSSGQFTVTLAAADGTSTIKPPTADPHVAGALWNDAGTPAISAG